MPFTSVAKTAFSSARMMFARVRCASVVCVRYGNGFSTPASDSAEIQLVAVMPPQSASSQVQFLNTPFPYFGEKYITEI